MTSSIYWTAGKKGPAPSPAPILTLTTSFRTELLAGSRRGHSRGADIHFDLLWLGLLALGKAESQNTILILRLDRVGIHGIRKSKAASERTIRALHAQIVLFVHFPLELAIPANREDVVLHTNVEVLGIDIGEIRLYHEFVFGLVDIDGGRPRAEAGFLAFAFKHIVEQAIELVLQSGDAAKGLPSSYRSHNCKHLLGDCVAII